MDDHAAILNAVGIGAIRRSAIVVSTASSLDNLAECLLHVLRHLDFVVAPLPMKPQHRDSPFIHRGWINFAVAVLVGDHLATACEADVCAVRFAASLLESRTVALDKV